MRPLQLGSHQAVSNSLSEHKKCPRHKVNVGELPATPPRNRTLSANKIRESGRFRCALCGFNGDSKRALNIHMGSQKHARNERIAAGLLELNGEVEGGQGRREQGEVGDAAWAGGWLVRRFTCPFILCSGFAWSCFFLPCRKRLDMGCITIITRSSLNTTPTSIILLQLLLTGQNPLNLFYRNLLIQLQHLMKNTQTSMLSWKQIGYTSKILKQSLPLTLPRYFLVDILFECTTGPRGILPGGRAVQPAAPKKIYINEWHKRRQAPHPRDGSQTMLASPAREDDSSFGQDRAGTAPCPKRQAGARTTGSTSGRS